MHPAPRTNSLAVGALICGFVFPILGIILGAVAKGQIRRSNGAESGGGMATAGIVLGIIGTIGAIVWIVAIVGAPSTDPGSYGY